MNLYEMNLYEFLLARINEDEKVARHAYYKGQRWFAEDDRVGKWSGGSGADAAGDADRKRDDQHIVRWQPARVLDECEAKRHIIQDWQERHELTARYRTPEAAARSVQALMAMCRVAAVYEYHPDYREEWRP